MPFSQAGLPTKPRFAEILQLIEMNDEEAASPNEEQRDHVAELAKKSIVFWAKIPDFELETWKLGCGKDKQCVLTDAVCIKCAGLIFACQHQDLQLPNNHRRPTQLEATQH